jgi:hypothetical protein
MGEIVQWVDGSVEDQAAVRRTLEGEGKGRQNQEEGGWSERVAKDFYTIIALSVAFLKLTA